MLELRRVLGLSLLGVVLAACGSSSDDNSAASVERDDVPNAEPTSAPIVSDSPVPSPVPAATGLGTAGSGNVGADEQAARPDANEGDRYESVGTNPFVLVAHDPLSTFAADVDTASYDVFERDIANGSRPQPASVRLEEYVNYFHYDYPAAAFDAPEPFSIFLGAAPNPLRAGTTLLRVGIQGKEAPPEVSGRPANLVFLVDVSGSMRAADRLPLAQQVLRQTLDILQPTDTVSIVSYASDTRVRLSPTPVSERATIVAQIDALGAAGSTAGAAGIDLAYAQASASFVEGGINHVILCTDGDFNVGPSSTGELLELIREKRRSGVTLTALGFGVGNLNDAMLEAVSNAGNGFHGVISSEQQAAEYVQERMLSTLSLIARDVKLQVEFNPQKVYAYRLLGYENRAIADDDFRDDIVDAGEIGSGHQVTALYELALRSQDVPTPENAPPSVGGAAFRGTLEVDADDLALVKVRYKTVDASEQDPAFEISAALSPAAVPAADTELDPDLDWAISIAAFAEILKESPYARPDAIDTLEASFAAQRERDDERSQFFQLFTQAKSHL